MSLRGVSCDDCTFASRYISDTTAFSKAKDHAQRLRHRTKVKAATGGEEDTVYDYRLPPPSTAT